MAVFTTLTQTDIEKFLQSYNLGALENFRGIEDGVSNTTYFIETIKGKYILSLYDYRTAPDLIPFFSSLMEYLSDRGFPCPQILRNQDRQFIRALHNKPALLVSFLNGADVARPTTTHCYEAGKALGKFHQIGESFPIPQKNPMGISYLRDLLAACDPQNSFHQAAQDALAEFKDSKLLTSLPQSTIHADYFPDNVFFENEKLTGVIDFHYACTDAMAYDLAIAINAWCFPDLQFSRDLSAHFLAGYQTIRPLSPAERDIFPALCRLAAARFLISRLHDQEFSSHQLGGHKNPEDFYKRLTFHQQTKNWGDYV